MGRKENGRKSGRIKRKEGRKEGRKAGRKEGRKALLELFLNGKHLHQESSACPRILSHALYLVELSNRTNVCFLPHPSPMEAVSLGLSILCLLWSHQAYC